MKLKLLYVLIAVIGLNACKTSKNASVKETENISGDAAAVQSIDFHDQSTWMLGFIDPSRLARYPHSGWYLKGYESYKTNAGLVSNLTQIMTPEIRITVVLGTWCPDSHREVPRFMKILKEINFPPASLTVIGADMDKLSPVGDFDKLGIQRVPTFIFYKKNIEAGRIIENPATSLEQDMINILTGNN